MFILFYINKKWDKKIDGWKKIEKVNTNIYKIVQIYVLFDIYINYFYILNNIT